MDPLYKLVKKLSQDEFSELYLNLTENKAEKSALFLSTIRESDNPVEDFLEKQEISASAFYVLKSRLYQKIESFLLNRLGGQKMELVYKTFFINDLIFHSPREISVTTLKKMEKTFQESDHPGTLMTIYQALKLLHNHDDEKRREYDTLYNEAVAHYLGNHKSITNIMDFFRSWDKYVLGGKERDYKEMIRCLEKSENIGNLYESQRMHVYKSIIQLFAHSFLKLPVHLQESLKTSDEIFNDVIQIFDKNANDSLYKNLSLVFDFLRFMDYYNRGIEDKAMIFYEILNNKIEELINEFNFEVDTTPFLFVKLEIHRQEGSLAQLEEEWEQHISRIEVDKYRPLIYVNFYLFEALLFFYQQKYKEAARVVYNLRNEINFRKMPLMDAQTKLLLALSYVMYEEYDLANQLALSLQRQLKKSFFNDYKGLNHLLRVITLRLSDRNRHKYDLISKHIAKFEEQRNADRRVLPQLELNVEYFKSVGTVS